MLQTFLKIPALALFAFPLFAQATFTYEGTLLDPSNAPITSANVVLKLEVLSASNNCILYGETQNIDTTTTNGYFSVNVGSGTSLGASSYTLNQVFNVATFTALTCDSGSTYTSGANEPRKLRVSVSVNSSPQDLLGSLTINPVPMATTADNARTVGGIEAKHMLKVDPSGMPGGTTAFSASQFSELIALISGTSTQYQPTSGPSGTVTAITAGTGLVGGTITTSGTLSVNVGTAPGQIPVLDAGGKIPMSAIPPLSTPPTGPAAGDLSGTYPAPTVNALRGQTIAGVGSMNDQVLVYNNVGYIWEPRRLGLQNMYSNMGMQQLPSSCGLGQTLNYSTVSDTFNCYTIQVTGSNLTLNSIGPTHLQPGIADSLWTAASGDIHRTTGRVGIGTPPASSAQLHVTNNAGVTPATMLLDSYMPATHSGANLILRSARGTSGGPGAVQNLDAIANLKAYAFDGTSFYLGADLAFVASANWSGSSRSTDIVFRTTAATTPAEVMRIVSNGNIGVGTSAPTEKLHVNGTVLATAHTNSSDIRLKKDIVKIQNPLQKILQISGVEYNWREDVVQPVSHDQKHDIGVIAQQVEEVFPEAVITSKENGYKAVAYTKLIAPLIEAVKALYFEKADLASVQKLESRLEKSEQENRELKARLEALEKLIQTK